MAAMTHAGIIDTRLLGKPRTYCGSRSDWPHVKYILKAYIGAISQEIQAGLDTVESQAVLVALAGMTPEQQQEARTLA